MTAPDRIRNRVRPVATLVLCALVYYGSARLGLALAFAHASASPVWPPTGIALAAVYLLGPRVWPGIFVGCFAANMQVVADLATTAPGTAIASALTIACGNTAEALVGAGLWRRSFGTRDPLARPGDLLRFMAVIPFACAISAGAGSVAVWIAGTPPSALPLVGLTWWLGDVTGGVVLAPALLAWGRAETRWPAPTLASWGALALTVGVTLLVFGGLAVDGPQNPLSYVLLLPLLWMAFRHGLRETATAVLVVCALSVWATLDGRGPFVLPSVNASLLVLQAFIAVITITMLSLAAALWQQRQSEERLQALANALERRVAERTRELSEANQQLQQAQKMEAIGTLAGGIAHDFNNLLTAIMMGTRMGRNAVPRDSPARESLAIAEQASEQAADLVAQLLTLGRKQARRTRRLDVGAVIPDTVKLLRRSLPETIEVVCELPPGPLSVDGDDAQLGQALLNLGINARDAMPDGGRLTISASVETLDAADLRNHPDVAPGSFVVVHVRDTGQGIDERTLQHIFEPFFTTKGPGRGTGLGLAMVYACMRDHDGFIRTHSRVGQGTHFELCLPQHRARPRGEDRPRSDRLHSTPPSP